MAKKFKFPVDSIVYYNGVPYKVQEQIKGQTGFWYLLLNRIGYVEETELKATAKN